MKNEQIQPDYRRLTMGHFDPHITTNELKLFKEVFSDEGWAYFKFLCRMESGNGHQVLLPALDTNAIQTMLANITDHFYQWVDSQYGLRTETAEQFVGRMLEESNQVMGYIRATLFPERKWTLNLRNELQVSPSDPIEMLHVLSSESDPLLRFEMLRSLLIAYVCAHLHSRDVLHSLRTKLYNLQKLFNGEIFSGRAGSSGVQQIFSLHDRENSTVAWDYTYHDLQTQRRPGWHIKSHAVHTRSLAQLDGLRVITNTRQKGYPAGVVKTMLKALQNGGVIDPLSFVQDSIGMLYAVMGGVEERNSVVELLKETLVSASKAGLLPDLVIKSRGNTTSKPTSTRNGMERFNVFLENSPVPVEIIVRSLPEFLDAEYHTGTCNPETGKWNGASHELFEIYRLMDLIPIFFPSDLYSHVGSDPTQSAHEHAQKVVQNLLTSHAIVLP